MQELLPIGNRVVVKPKSREEKTASGIILAGEEEEQDQGTVINVGDGSAVQIFKIGDVLLYQKFGPIKATLNKEKFAILDIEEISAKIIDK